MKKPVSRNFRQVHFEYKIYRYMAPHLPKFIIRMLFLVFGPLGMVSVISLAVSGFQDRNLPLAFFASGLLLVFLAAATKYLNNAKRFDKLALLFFYAGIGLFVLSVLLHFFGLWLTLIILVVFLSLGALLFGYFARQNTLHGLLRSRLSGLGFEEKLEPSINGYTFTRDGILIQEDRTDYRNGSSRIRCEAPNAKPLDQTFYTNARDEMYAAITAWLLENKIMDLEKEYQTWLQQEINNRR